MGKRGRKKGRPSLLDLQKRSLRLQKQNPNPNNSDDSDDDDDDHSLRHKKLKHVLHLSADKNSGRSEDTDPGDSGTAAAATALPDKKLLVTVLDRLQKKDTYGVYAEPVDPDELPDYHDIIKHPMDFRTVREKLADGAYANLEEFESDVFLISTNAMQYNSADTVYYKQARSIHELAKKDFESLRQESDDNEPETKVVRRGRPPNKNNIKRPVGRPPVERTSSDFSSDAAFGNARDNGHWSNLVLDSSRKGSVLDVPGTAGVPTRASHGISYNEKRSWASEHKPDRNEEHSGYMGRNAKMKNWRNPSVIDENRRNTYIQSQSSTSTQEPLISTTFSGERKLLVPVGLQMEQAYARSLAMFAAELGPVAWEIASKRIERVLPPGTQFGCGWVGENEAPQQRPLLTTPPPQPSSGPKYPSFTGMAIDDQHSVKHEATEAQTTEADARTTVSAAAAPNRSSEPVGSSHLVRGSVEVGSSGMRPTLPLQMHQKIQNPAIQQPVNGFNNAHGFNLLSQVEKMGRQVSPLGSFGLEGVTMTHVGALDMVSRNCNNFAPQGSIPQVDTARVKSESVGNTSVVLCSSPSQEMDREPRAQWRGSSMNPKPGPDPPDLNVGFQSPGSSISGTPVETQQPDLVLQL